MKSAYAVVIVLALLFVSACTQKVNDPADVKAIKDLNEGYDKAESTGDLAWFNANYYADKAVTLPPNQPLISGKEAIAADDQKYFDRYSSVQLSSPVEEVLTSGDLAVARGAYTWKGTPKASGLSEVTEQGKWIGIFQKQRDGSWKCSEEIWNSDQPAPGKTADGADEQALLQIERDFTSAMIKKDRAAMENILAADFVGRGPEGVQNKRQVIASIMGSALKIESAEITNMQPMVFGETAVVYGTSSEKSTTGGRDSSGQYRWTDIFEKLDGRWQCVGGYVTRLP
jgi:ketosteroid isomerase-like protein